MNKVLICPVCGGDDLKEIIYGLPDPEGFDFEKYEIGGCCITPNDPGYLCLGCNNRW